MKTAIFKIVGMDCAEEVRAIKKEFKVGFSEQQLHFDVLNGKLSITGDDEQLNESSLIKLVKKAGYKAIPWDAYIIGKEVSEGSFIKKHIRLILTLISAFFLLFGFAIHAINHGAFDALAAGEIANHSYPTLSIIAYLFAIVTGAWFIVPKALGAAKRRRADINLLMVIAVIGAILIGQWFEGAAVTTLFSLALLLESWSVGRARQAIKSLMSIAPETARAYACCGKIVEKKLDEVKVDQICIVRPGERIPFDGVITKGDSYINEAPITGESMPVNKNIGSDVFSGTINGDYILEIKVSKEAKNSTLSRIIAMVEDAQSKRATSEKWVEKFAAVYTPAMIVFALLVAIVPPLIFAGEWSRWIYEGLVILVIACPCALVISTPVSIVSGLSRSARNGVLIKGGNFLELPSKLKVVAFDKTGTLTKGEPVVQNIIPLDKHSEAQLLATAAALEVNTDHPLAKAILSYTNDKNIAYTTADKFQIIQGKGAEGVINGKKYWLGSHKFLHERLSKDDICLVHENALKFEQQGHSVIVIGTDDHICGIISLADKIRDEAKSTLDELKKSGIEKLIMLTGDNKGTAKAVADKLGIAYEAELLPEGKVKYVKELRKKYEHIAMVGDGINDAPAMVAAEISIAMGAAGSDAAIETADVALMADEISKLPWLIQHSKKVMAVIKQNIYFALGIKLVFIILALFGLATLWMAIAADMGTSLLVIFNSLRLLKKN